MMWIIIGLIVGLCMSLVSGGSWIQSGLIGLLLGWVFQLSNKIAGLEQQVQTLTTPALSQAADSSPATATVQTQSRPEFVEKPESSVEKIPSPADTLSEVPTANLHEDVSPCFKSIKPIPDKAPQPSKLDKLINAGRDWLLGGNPFVRVGIVVLFIGVVFLLRYSLERNLIPVELRLMASAAGAFALLAIGWRLRERAGAYGLILQAGGIGLLYLTVFAAFSLYHLIPALLAFGLLVVIVACAVVLAVLQDSLPLAVFATVGGFAVPLLTSSGNNNYIGLFSFYAILNAGIVALAWFKQWRWLNLIGFVFTFVIAAVWGWFSYKPEDFAASEFFLMLFFLFYVLISVLFATRSPVNFKDKVDSTLVFGVPLLGFGMQIALVRSMDYGIAISALVLGAFYCLLAVSLWKWYGRAQQLLTETFLALGIVFATLAIPFAVDGTLTAAAWALEGVGILWISIRQQQLLRRWFGVFLQAAALLSLLYDVSVAQWQGVSAEQALWNGTYLASVLIAAAMLVSAWLLSRPFAGKRASENGLSTVLLVSGLLVQCLGFEWQVIEHSLPPVNSHLIYSVVTTGILLLCLRLPAWPQLRFALPLPVVSLLIATACLFSGTSHVSLWWLLALAALYALLFAYAKQQMFPNCLAVMQVITAWVLILIAYHVFFDRILRQWPEAWSIVISPMLAIAFVWFLLRAPVWPLTHYRALLRKAVVLPLTALLVLWVVLSLGLSGDSAPLPWIPVLNPLDIVLGFIGLTIWAVYRRWPTLHVEVHSYWGIYAGIFTLFVWLNWTVLRAQHHWAGLPWSESLLFMPSTQTGLAVLWAVTGLLLTWTGHRRVQRPLWIAGAAMLVLVVLKLFLVDFASSGTLERVISFMSVGVLLLFIGYLAPLPPAKTIESMSQLTEGKKA
ncbi:MAG: hypothetical protein CR991_08750 [Proteobacteria bacterium]|nr:MAG: hypothetical protein CR991_08750 [Pseudomonadota bacterium]